MKKPALIASITAGVILIGGGGYALGTMNGNDTEAVTVATQAPSPEQPSAAAPEPTPTPTAATPDEEFTAMLDGRHDTKAYPQELLHKIGQEVCTLFEDDEDVHPFTVTESSHLIEYSAYIETWGAALSTDGYCD